VALVRRGNGDTYLGTALGLIKENCWTESGEARKGGIWHPLSLKGWFRGGGRDQNDLSARGRCTWESLGSRHRQEAAGVWRNLRAGFREKGELEIFGTVPAPGRPRGPGHYRGLGRGPWTWRRLDPRPAAAREVEALGPAAGGGGGMGRRGKRAPRWAR
jgi:hypothetical protein